jgi:hypothetical protein
MENLIVKTLTCERSFTVTYIFLSVNHSRFSSRTCVQGLEPEKMIALRGHHLLLSLWAREGTSLELRSIADIINDLSKPIPARLLKAKTVGGQKIRYLPWHTAVKFLDLYAPGWSYEVRHVTGIGNKLVIVSRVSIPCAEGVVYREATGQEDEDVDRFGDPSSNAESMSLRRAAAKFGLGLYLYDTSRPQSEGRES